MRAAAHMIARCRYRSAAAAPPLPRRLEGGVRQTDSPPQPSAATCRPTRCLPPPCAATCNACGPSGCYHIACVQPLLSRVHHDSTRAMERARRNIQFKPAHYMATVRLPCPRAEGCSGARAGLGAASAQGGGAARAARLGC